MHYLQRGQTEEEMYIAMIVVASKKKVYHHKEINEALHNYYDIMILSVES